MNSLRILNRYFSFIASLAFLLLLAGCGSGSSTANPNSVTGKWTVTLFNPNHDQIYVFTTTLNQEIATPSTTSPVAGSDLNLTTNNQSSCFAASSSSQQTGIYTVSDNFNGLTANTLQLTIQGTTGNMVLKGTFTTSGISGPWNLTTSGTGCDLAGTFLMTRI